MTSNKQKRFFLLLLSIACISCNAPRSILTSGKVVPKNQVRIGKNYTINLASAPIIEALGGTVDVINNPPSGDTISLSQLQKINSLCLSYCLDPVGYNNEYFFRYGLGHRLDAGYRYLGGAHAFDMMFQFLGSNKSFNESEKGGIYGSIGLQYSWENYKFLNYKYIDKLEKFLGIQMWRKDLTIPLIFSKSWGPEERVGCFSFGVVYQHSFVKYKISQKDVFYIKNNFTIPSTLVEPINTTKNFGAYGAFINLKVGKKIVYFNFSLSAYYQDYKSYPLFGGGSAHLSGFSIVPSYGVQFNILPKKKKKKGTEV